MRGERPPSIPRFPPTSLTTTAFRWLHSEAWDDRQIAAFTAARMAPAAGLYAPVPFVKARHRGTPYLAGRWLLERADGAPLAAAEAQVQTTGFTAVTLLVSEAAEGGGWAAPPCFAALTLLVSGVMLLAGADLVRLAPLGDVAGRSLAGLDLGAATRVWTPLSPYVRMTTARAGLNLPLITLVPHDWWATAHGAEGRKTLAYLEKRLRHARMQEKAPAPRRLGVAARLARLWGRD